MKRDEITRLFQSLARSQGCYGRLLRNIDNMNERTEYERAKVSTNYEPI